MIKRTKNISKKFFRKAKMKMIIEFNRRSNHPSPRKAPDMVLPLPKFIRNNLSKIESFLQFIHSKKNWPNSKFSLKIKSKSLRNLLSKKFTKVGTKK